MVAGGNLENLGIDKRETRQLRLTGTMVLKALRRQGVQGGAL
jgi:hypothetical protein